MSCVETRSGRRLFGVGAAASAAAAALLMAGCAGDAVRLPEREGSDAPVRGATLPAPTGKAKSWDDYKRQAGRRMLASNPQMHDGPVEQPSLAIPVLRVVLNAEGAVQKVEVVRRPSQAGETTQLAIDAVKRAAPYGAVSHLPKPWEFTEAFLFNEDRRFKPATLDR